MVQYCLKHPLHRHTSKWGFVLIFAIWLCKFSKILYVSMTTIMVCFCLLKLQSTSTFTAVSIFHDCWTKRFESMHYLDVYGEKRKKSTISLKIFTLLEWWSWWKHGNEWIYIYKDLQHINNMSFLWLPKSHGTKHSRMPTWSKGFTILVWTEKLICKIHFN